MGFGYTDRERRDPIAETPMPTGLETIIEQGPLSTLRAVIEILLLRPGTAVSNEHVRLALVDE